LPLANFEPPSLSPPARKPLSNAFFVFHAHAWTRQRPIHLSNTEPIRSSVSLPRIQERLWERPRFGADKQTLVTGYAISIYKRGDAALESGLSDHASKSLMGRDRAIDATNAMDVAAEFRHEEGGISALPCLSVPDDKPDTGMTMNCSAVWISHTLSLQDLAVSRPRAFPCRLLSLTDYGWGRKCVSGASDLYSHRNLLQTLHASRGTASARNTPLAAGINCSILGLLV
jgi:hypothetical protein